MEIPQKSKYIPKTPNEYYKAGEEELDNPKYFCIDCGAPLYSSMMLDVKRDRNKRPLYGAQKPPTKFYYICMSRGCSQQNIEISKITLENARILTELTEVLKLKFEKDNKEEDPELTEE